MYICCLWAILIVELEHSKQTENIHFFEEFEHIFYSFMIPRSSYDSVISSSGIRLVEFCKTYGTYIANGRLGKDANRGSFTYIGPNGCSLTDSLLISHELFDTISNFCIGTRTESTHLPVCVDIFFKTTCK